MHLVEELNDAGYAVQLKHVEDEDRGKQFIRVLDDSGKELAACDDFQCNPWSSRKHERAAEILKLLPKP